MFGDKFVLEYVVREFLLLVLLLYQLLVATSEEGDGSESDLPQVKSTPAGNPLINLVSVLLSLCQMDCCCGLST